MVLLPFILSAAFAVEPVAGATAPSAPATQPAATESPAATEPKTLTYAMRQVFTSEMRDPNPFSSTGWKSTHTHTWAVVTWTQKGDEVTYDERTCGLETDKVFGATTTYTPAFIKSIPVRHRKAKLSGGKFKAGPYVQSFGVKLADAYDDPLPTDPKDSRLVDTDGDGHPGVTVEISHPVVGKGQVWIAQRSVARLEGTSQSDGTIRGVIYTAPDMYKIGANRWWLRGDTPQRQHPDPKMSPFVLVPAASGLTCAQLLQQKDTLFPPVF